LKDKLGEKLKSVFTFD